MGSRRDYNWIDDPFSEKPQQEKQGMGARTKAAIGCGCLIGIVGIVIAAVLFFSGLFSVLAG